MTEPAVDVVDARAEQANKLYQTGVMLIYGKRKSIEKAIKCIQKAITFNDSDYKYWQLLGEAYYQRGSLNPAINCFLRSLKLAEDEARKPNDDATRRKADCVYSRIRMSDIRLSVGHLSDAITGYQDILERDAKNVAALVGLAKANLRQARNHFSAGLIKSGHHNCMEALRSSLRAIKISPHLCLTWKLASDCCLVQFIYGQRGHFETRICEKFLESDDELGLLITRMSCIELAQQFLSKAIVIEPFHENGCLWHNLGLSLYLKSTIISDQNERFNLLKRSLKCLLKALDFDRNSSQIKNSIGVVAFNLNLLNTAQNYLIRSIRANMSTSEIQFSNLGFMYTQKGEFHLADVAFNRCQAEEPLYARSWLGNALICEQKNQDNLTQLRHCHKLENNYESQLMYATKVTSLPHNREYSRDLLYAFDSMQRVINYNRLSLEALNTLGLLYERCNFKDQARLCFEAAFKIRSSDSRIVFNRLRQHHVSNDCCFGGSLGFAEPSDAELIRTAGKLADSGNTEYILNYIYFLFANGDYRNVNPRMTKLIDKLPREDIKNKIGAQILLGLAAKAVSGDYKSWLFKNIIDSENLVCVESLINLLALMLIGANSQDEQLVNQISNDIHRHLLLFLTTRNEHPEDLLDSIEGKWTKLTVLCSIFCLKDKGKLIRPMLALFPTVAEFWLFMGLSLISEKNKAQIAIDCIKKASQIGSSLPEVCFVCDLLLSVLCQSVKAKPETVTTRTKYLSRAINKYPNYNLLWEILFAHINSERKDKTKLTHLLSQENSNLIDLAVDHILAQLGSS